MNKNMSQHFTPHATLCALGATIQSLKLFDIISQHVHIHQKKIKHEPIDKLYDAFIAILAGAHGLCEIQYPITHRCGFATRLWASGLC